ncbi:MAG: hypothetical protein HYV76_02375 [Candidatus Vogelbacteria bacterium]|nr:hypothetical protein [Candidatus Vogelbacteria bacterium]
MKNALIFIIIILVIAGGAYWFWSSQETVITTLPPIITATTTPVIEDKTKTIIGQSVEGRNIMAYHFGTGPTELVFIGGIHGGYEWNTSLVAYELMDYLKTNSDAVPANITVTVIPVLNPDGLIKVISTTTAKFAVADVISSSTAQVAGRFNANKIDLNRNFDCDWQATGVWQNTPVKAGSTVFSEPESLAIKNYVENQNPKAVVVWYSSAGGVFASNCHDGILPETLILTNTYAKASGYPAHERFDFYAITGDLVNWLAKKEIPAISVLLTNHTSTEWNKNQAGVQAILKYYTK